MRRAAVPFSRCVMGLAEWCTLVDTAHGKQLTTVAQFLDQDERGDLRVDQEGGPVHSRRTRTVAEETTGGQSCREAGRWNCASIQRAPLNRSEPESTTAFTSADHC